MKRKAFAAAAMLAVCCCMGSLSASAISADDVASKARELGWPEDMIQNGYNMWSSGAYSQDDLQRAYDALYKYPDAVDDKIGDVLGGGEEETPAETPTAASPSGNSSSGGASGGNSSTGGTSGNTSSGGNSASGGNTVTKKDGTVEERISPADFIGMTLEEKKAYTDSLTPESRQAFLDSLTTEERNSIIKQMPVDSQADIMQIYIDTAKEMGINVTVDSLSEGNISLTVRDDEGKVIGKQAMGITIDETGISHTKPLLFALGGTLAALAGFGGLYYYIRRTEEE